MTNVIPFRAKRVEAVPANDNPDAPPKKEGGISPGLILLMVGGVVAIAAIRQQSAEAKERERLRELEDHVEAMERNEAASRTRLYDRPIGPGPWF